MQQFIPALQRVLLYVLLYALPLGLQAQNITQMEYFFDHDPSIGNGTLVNITSPSDYIDDSFAFSTNGISVGLHTLFIRTKNADGVWSHTTRKLILIDGNAGYSEIVKVEYFFDNDPGIGNGTSIDVSAPAESIDQLFSLSTDGISTGLHTLSIRVQNSNGVWSLATRKLILIDGNAGYSEIVKVEYFFDTDPGIGNGTSIDVSAPAESIDQLFSLSTRWR